MSGARPSGLDIWRTLARRGQTTTPPDPPPSETHRVWVYFGPTEQTGSITKGTVRVSVTLNDSNVAFSDAHELRVADSAGNPLNYERISYDSGTGALDIDVELGTFNGPGGYLIQIAYGDSGQSDISNAAAAHSDFLAWWTFPSGVDKTSGSYDLSPANISSTTLFGRTAGSFNGTNSVATRDPAFVNNLLNVSGFAIVDATGVAGNNKGICSQGDQSGDEQANMTLQALASSSAGVSVWHFRGALNEIESAYTLGVENSANMAEGRVAYTRTSGQLPRIFVDGAESGSGNGSSKVGNFVVQPGNFAVGRGARVGSEWPGKIGIAAIRARAINAAQEELEARSWTDADLCYGVSAEVAAADGNEPPVAVDVKASVTASTTTDIAVLARSIDPDGGTLSLSAVGTATSGSVSVNGNLAEYVAPSSPGTATFTFTVAEPGGKTAQATCRVTITAATGGGGGSLSFPFTPPPIPSDTSRYKLWTVGTSMPSHNANDIILGIMPDGGFTGSTGTQNNVKCPVIIWGGSWFPSPTTTIEGIDGIGILCRVQFQQNAQFNNSRPFFWISNIHHDNTVNSCHFHDWFRVGSALGTNVNNLANLYFGYLRQTGNRPRFGSNTSTHSDLWQGAGNDYWHQHWWNNRIVWGQQGHFVYPSEIPQGGSYHPGQTCFIKDSVYYTSPKFSGDTREPKFTFKPAKAGIYNHSTGEYCAFVFDNVWCVPDADVTNKINYFDPKNPGGTQVQLAGNTFILPTKVGGPHVLPEYSGSCYHGTPPFTPVAEADAGDSHRKTTAADLIAVWPGGTY